MSCRNILKIIFIIIGSFVGAGFASGKEIHQFFYVYGTKGIIGMIISFILIGIIIYKTLILVRTKNIENYEQFLKIIFEKKIYNGKNKKIIQISINIIKIFILVTFYIMIAAFNSFFQQQYGISKLIASIIICIIIYFTLSKKVDGVIKVNQILVPIILLAILGISIYFINTEEINILNIKTQKEEGSIFSGILYASYNSILMIPLLISSSKLVKSKKDVIVSSLISFFLLLVFSIQILMYLSIINVDIDQIEMPIVYLVSEKSMILKNIYGIIILSSIFTTAISLGVAFLENLEIKEKSYPQIVKIMCITSIIISQISFSQFINIAYPVFGIIGIFQMVKILKY